MIWNRIPKTRYCGLDKLELAVYDAVVHFNIGRMATIKVFETLNIISGVYTLELWNILNNKGNQSAAFKEMDSSKKQRKIIRNLKKMLKMWQEGKHMILEHSIDYFTEILTFASTFYTFCTFFP